MRESPSASRQDKDHLLLEQDVTAVNRNYHLYIYIYIFSQSTAVVKFWFDTAKVAVSATPQILPMAT